MIELWQTGTNGTVSTGTDYEVAKTVNLSGNSQTIWRIEHYITGTIQLPGSSHRAHFKYTDGTEAPTLPRLPQLEAIIQVQDQFPI